MDRYFVVCLSLTLSVTDNVTTLQLIQGKSKTGPHLRSMSYWHQELKPAVLKVCMSSSAAARVFLLIGKLCALSVLPQLNQYGQRHWLAKNCCMLQIQSSSAQVIDSVGDLLPRSVTACYYFFQIRHFLHVQIDFLVHSACIERHILISSHIKNAFHFLGDLFICRFDSFCNIFCSSRMMYDVWVSRRWNTPLETMLAMWNIMKEHASEGSGSYHYRVAKDVFG